MFEIYGGCLQNVNWMIFDRWGGVVFETNDVTQSWDGTGKNGQVFNTGVFSYLLKGVNEDDSEVNLYGIVNLIR